MRNSQIFIVHVHGTLSGRLMSHEAYGPIKANLRLWCSHSEFLQDAARHPGVATHQGTTRRLWDVRTRQLPWGMPGALSCGVHRENRYLLRRSGRIAHVAASLRGCGAVEPRGDNLTRRRGRTASQDIYCVATNSEASRSALISNPPSALFLRSAIRLDRMILPSAILILQCN